jgi:hypothetical protein
LRRVGFPAAVNPEDFIMRIPALLIAFVFAAAASAAAQVPAQCKAAVEAGVRVITTPHHAVDKEGSRPRILEMITANGQNYVKIDGGPWKTSPMTPDRMAAQEQENIKNARNYRCTQLPDDQVDGAPAAVYKVHYDLPDVGTSDAQIWVSKATGLPLKTEQDLNFGGARHMSIKYDYANIQAPIVK